MRACQLVTSHASFDLILSSGFVGALAPAKIGDIIIATHVKAFSYDQSDLGSQLSHFCDPTFHRMASHTSELLGDQTLAGLVVTVSRVLCTPEEKKLLAGETGAVGVEMESAGIGKMARDKNIPFLMVRVVSDELDESLPMDFNTFRTPGGWIRGVTELLWHPRLLVKLYQFRKQTVVASRQITRFLRNFLVEIEKETQL